MRLLVYTDAGVLKIALGIFLLAFGTYALLAPRLHTYSGGGRIADAGVGFLGGILGGIGGYSGVLPTIWTQLRGWPKDVARAVYQPYIIVMHALALAGIVWVTLDRAGADNADRGAAAARCSEPGSAGSFTAGSTTGASARRLPCC